ncbi:sulfurtransferase-like selenium metabolism protein YedF [Paucidesulfovibrio longus]|uniref:sulfurtransferase-like selenium metabolism protein YedF n=1 Tax=Paucidesulfovibrio longus TaxID=889 RepID=UPI0003B3C15B|nr:sulfurtransferase-like selenium metabolism protein YedF [Paucidesulfovibrio longus]
MNEIRLECQGLPCPQPVLKCKKCIENDSPEALAVVVDNEPARENVSRFLASKGYRVSVEEQNGLLTIRGLADESKESGTTDKNCAVCEVMSGEELESLSARTVAFITTAQLGVGDDELGEKLMLNFLATLPELGSSLWRIVLVNGGVRLACDGHPCLEKLETLAKAGVEILVCGTCLDFFGLLEKKRIGETTNMLDVVTSLQLASKVIKV